jgi:hypothetical protein
MILLDLCCPPLPVMAVRQGTGEQTVTNTHDMLSVFMAVAFKRQDEKENHERMEKQIAALEAYCEGLERCTNFTLAYAHMSRFTTEYLASYLLQGTTFSKHDIRILSPDYISPNLKQNIRSYCEAVGMIELGSSEPLQLSDYSVDALFMSCISSAIHKKQQRVVGVPVFEGVRDDVSKERHNPQAFEPCVEVL